MTAKIAELWDPGSEAIGQVGLLGDESGIIKFTARTKSGFPEFQDGLIYRIGNVVTDEYRGRKPVKLNRRTPSRS